MNRKVTPVKVGNIIMGDGSVSIQSMLNCPPHLVEENITQAMQLEQAGCDVVRIAVPDSDAVALIPALKEKIAMPVVADIHFDYRLALACAEAGVDKIRINPGNIGDDDHVKKVVDACKMRQIPIRIGVNSGSVEKHILAKYQRPVPEALVESAMYHVRLLERFDFDQIVISIKSSDVPTMVRAYELLAEQTSYPLHLGVTEAGTEYRGVLKSAIGIGSLLLHGIGDTIRVSLTADPVREIYAAQDILNAIGRYPHQIELVSCPTCGRTKIDLISLANQVEQALKPYKVPLKVAVMGCVVNGPGEAKEADIGIAGGDGCAVLFKKGQIICKIAEDQIVPVLLKEIEAMVQEQK